MKTPVRIASPAATRAARSPNQCRAVANNIPTAAAPKPIWISCAASKDPPAAKTAARKYTYNGDTKNAPMGANTPSRAIRRPRAM